MTQVIAHVTASGNVAITIPTGELSIVDTQKKDTPAGSVIIDAASLPQGDDAQFFDAWKLNGSTVTVDMPTAITVAATRINGMAYSEAQHRAAKAGAGLTNVLADADWLALLTTARAAVSAATTTTALLAALAPVQSAITANA